MDLVTVIITTYNRFDLCLKAIKSVQSQTYQNLEIIVIDDCSTDERYLTLPDIFKEDKRVIIKRLPINKKEEIKMAVCQGETRNEGLKIAKGEYIAFLDDDDEFLPVKIERQLSFFKEFPHIKIIGTNVIFRNGDKLTINADIDLPLVKDNIYFVNKELMDVKNRYTTSTVMISRDILNNGIKFRATNKIAWWDYEDYHFWKDCLTHSNGLYVNELLVLYEITPKSKNY